WVRYPPAPTTRPPADGCSLASRMMWAGAQPDDDEKGLHTVEILPSARRRLALARFTLARLILGTPHPNQTHSWFNNIVLKTKLNQYGVNHPNQTLGVHNVRSSLSPSLTRWSGCQPRPRSAQDLRCRARPEHCRLVHRERVRREAGASRA